MASGDVFSNMYLGVGSSITDIIPAGTAKVCITFIGCSDAGCEIYGRKSTGGYIMKRPTSTGGGSDDLASQTGWENSKMLITNSQYFGFRTASGTKYYSYSGVEF